jgi:hypothetical protein
VYDCALPAAPLAEAGSPREAELVRTADVLFLGESQADLGSWDGLAAHMLAELAKAEGAGRRPPLYEREVLASRQS